MNKIIPTIRWQSTLLLAFCLLLVLFTVILAQSGEAYNLSWSIIAGGGGNSTGGSYALGGTAGQTGAGMVAGGSYTLVGGAGVNPAQQYGIYLPLIIHSE